MLGELGDKFYTAQGMQSGLESAPLKQVESRIHILSLCSCS